MHTSLPEAVYARYLSSLLAGERAECRRIVSDVLAMPGRGPRAVYLELFQRSLYDVGQLWETNQISVATEHMVTAITEGLFAVTYPLLFSGRTAQRTAVIACVPCESHQVGAHIVADLLELGGVRTTFLGANTPADALVRWVSERQPDVVGLSLSIGSNVGQLAATLEPLLQVVPRERVVLGGRAFQGWSEPTLAPFGVRVFADVRALEAEFGAAA
jgi:methanogenic corrinoid protein MtbC1